MIKQMHKIKCGKAPLSADEMDALSVRARAGDDRAAWKMVEHNTRFVFHLVSQICKPDQFEDLYQVGVMAAFGAAKLWNRAQGSNFTTYASLRIRAYVARERDRMDCVVIRGVRFLEMQRIKKENPGLEKHEYAEKLSEWKNVGSTCEVTEELNLGTTDVYLMQADQRIDIGKVKAAIDWLPIREKEAAKFCLTGGNATARYEGADLIRHNRYKRRAINSLKKIMEVA